MTETYRVVVLDDLVQYKSSKDCCHADGDVLHTHKTHQDLVPDTRNFVQAVITF